MNHINQLILGDNLEVMKLLKSESIDLVYLDPPFFANHNYMAIWGDAGEVRSFNDQMGGGMETYISWLKERIEQIYRLLKPTGSIFVHCDQNANAYIRVEILDILFGPDNFQNCICWQRATSENETKKLGNIHDTIYWYSKSEKKTCNSVFRSYSDVLISRYKHQDDKGRYRTENLTAAHYSATRTFEWRGIHPGENRHWRYGIDKLEELLDNGFILLQEDERPKKDGLKVYLDETKGIPLQDIWPDCIMAPNSPERIGYTDQKPIALMQRIIEIASKEGDLVLDPFAGGGTTVAVADKLNRKWIGIDQSVQAIKVTEFRLNQQQNLFSRKFTVQLNKYDYDTLRHKHAFSFEDWIIKQYGGTSVSRHRNNFGLHGKTNDNIPIQVKRLDNVGRKVIENFLPALQRYDNDLFVKNKEAHNPVGCIIAFSFSEKAIKEAARLKDEDNVIVKLVKVQEIVPIPLQPKLCIAITARTTERDGHYDIIFKAAGQSEAGIEFYSWDFHYNNSQFRAEVLFDKTGEQTWRYEPGHHVIAVKVIDKDGLENIEVIKLNLNAGVERE